MPRHMPSRPVSACQFDSPSILVNDGCVLGRKGEFDVLDFGDLFHLEEVGVVVIEFAHKIFIIGEIVRVAHGIVRFGVFFKDKFRDLFI